LFRSSVHLPLPSSLVFFAAVVAEVLPSGAPVSGVEDPGLVVNKDLGVFKDLQAPTMISSLPLGS
jgi:hypothetical protein